MLETINKPVIFLAFANDPQGGRLDLAEEKRRLQEALEVGLHEGLYELVVQSDCTAGDIFKVLQDPRYRNRIAIFHYAGHANGYQLLLESRAGQSAAADAAGLADFLGQQRGLRLVFLNGCSTQLQTHGLLAANIAAAIATSRAIDDRAAIDFSVQFYYALARGASLRTAYNEASAAVKTTQGSELRGLYFDESDTPEDHRNEQGCPWNLYLPDGNEGANQWNLPAAAGDPTFGLPALPEQALPDTPYRHLKWFTREDAEVFFGRDYQIRELYDRLTAPRSAPLMLFYGQSGVGKSSILDAGLFPRLERDYEVRYLRRASNGLLETLRAAFTPAAATTTTAVTDEPIESAWHKLETQCNKPLIIFLDQVEELFTRPLERLPDELDEPDELDAFLQVVKATFLETGQRPRGKLVLGFRKEWLAELEKRLATYALPRAKFFLEPLDRRGIIEAVEGPTRTERRRQKYGLTVEDDLAEIIAGELLQDREAAIAPTLQILLTKLWTRATSENYDKPQFSQDLYQQLHRDGILLRDFLQQQINAFRGHDAQAVDSGLLLDILALHTTPLGTANQCTGENLARQYGHLGGKLTAYLQRCQDLHLLTIVAGPQKESPLTTRLAHDTLAPLVRERLDESDAPGQRARRILDARFVDWKEGGTGAPLDEVNLRMVEQGRVGTRIWSADEQRLVDASRTARAQRQRNQQNLRIAGIVAAVLILLAAGVAWWKWGEAAARLRENEKLGLDKQTLSKEIESGTRRFTALNLAARAQTLRFQAPEQSVTDALAALQQTGAETLYLPEAESALRQVLASIEGRRIPGRLQAVSDDSDLFVTTSQDDSAAVWKFGVDQPIRIIGSTGQSGNWVFAGKWLAHTNARKSQTTLYDLTNPNAAPRQLPGHGQLAPPDWYIEIGTGEKRLIGLADPERTIAAFRSFVLSDQGQWLLTVDGDGQAERLQLSSEIQRSPLGRFEEFEPAAVSSDGSWSVLQSSRELVLVDTRNPDQRRVLLPELAEGEEVPAVRGRRIGTLENIGGRTRELIRFSPDNRWLIATAAFRESNILQPPASHLFVWDLSGPAQAPRRMDRHSLEIEQILFAENSFVTRDATQMYLTSLETPNVERLRAGSIAFRIDHSPDRRFLLTGFLDNSLGVLDTRQADEPPRALYGHSAPPRLAAMSQNHEWIVSDDGTQCRLWHVPPNFRGTEPLVFPRQEAWTVAEFSADGQTVFVGGAWLRERAPLWSVRIKSPEQGQITNLFDSYHELNSLRASPDGRWLAAASGYVSFPLLFSLTDSEIKSIDVKGLPYEGGIPSFSDDSRWLVLTNELGAKGLFRLDPARRAAEPVRITELQFVENISLSKQALIAPGSQWLLTAGEDSRCQLWDLSPGQLDAACEMTPPSWTGWKLASASRDGRWVLLAGEQQEGARLIDLTRPLERPLELPAALATTETLEISPDARWMVTQGKKQATWQVWKLGAATPKLAFEFNDSADWAEFAPDSRSLFAWGKHLDHVLAWRMTDGQEISGVPLKHGAGIHTVKATADGQCLLTSDSSGVIRLFDLADLSRSPAILGAHRGPILAWDISPDNERLVTLGTDQALQLWRLWAPGAERHDRLRPLTDLAKTILTPIGEHEAAE